MYSLTLCLSLFFKFFIFIPTNIWCASLSQKKNSARLAFARAAHLFRHSPRAPLATATLRADDQTQLRAHAPLSHATSPTSHAPTVPVVLRKNGPEPLIVAPREQPSPRLARRQDVLVRARDARRSLKALDPGRPSGRLAVQDAHVLGWEELQPARVQAHRGLGGGSVRRGHVGRTPAPVRKPVVEVGGGALGPAPTQAAAARPPRLCCSGGSSRQRRRQVRGGSEGLGISAPLRTRHIFEVAQGLDRRLQGHQRIRHQTHLRARDATPLKPGWVEGVKRHCPAPQLRCVNAA